MNKYLICLILFLTFILQSCTTDADDDSDNWDAAKVCPETGNNSYGMPNRGTFVDERDGQVYKYTTIGNQVWMAENLRYDAEYSECEDVFEGFCETFGRYYTLAKDGENMGSPDTSVSNHICPEGWHLPEKGEWESLLKNMGGNDELAVSRLKSETFWGVARDVGSDMCAFNALPAGESSNKGSFYSSVYAVNVSDSFSTSTSCDMESGFSFGNSWFKMSIRCIKD